jgi:glycerate-2-kinase
MRSAAAADSIASFCRATPPGATVWFLLSGGATSLMAGPEPRLTVQDLQGSYDQLLRSGLDIRAMNLVRKRLSRWGGGKLALVLAHAHISQFTISDVVGDTLDAIGSGPMVADGGTANEAVALIDQAGLRPLLPPTAMTRLDDLAAGRISDLPLPSTPELSRVRTAIVASNRTAVDAVIDLARERGWAIESDPEPMTGEAAEVGAGLGARLLSGGRRLVVTGGETTVHLSQAAGRGGRNQELALAAAQVLGKSKTPVALLAAGTDGRDGPTDAAGGLVDQTTWRRIKSAGVDPAAALENHDAYRALAASGDLLHTGPTGTNVMDLVIAAREDSH